MLICLLVIVDRILQKQRAERQAAEDAAKEKARQSTLVSDETKDGGQGPPPVPPRPGSLPPGVALPSSNTSESTLSDSDHTRGTAIRNSIGDFSRRFLGKGRAPIIPGSMPEGPETNGTRDVSPNPTQGPVNGNLPLLPPPRPNASRPQTPGPSVTPMSNISMCVTLQCVRPLM